MFLLLLKFRLVEVPLLDQLSDELIGRTLANFLFEIIQLILHSWLPQVFIHLESQDNRTEGVFLVMQVLSQIDDLILELNNSFLEELFVLEPHLLLHQQDSIDILVFVIILLYFFT